MESKDSPEIPDRGVTSDIPGLPSGVTTVSERLNLKLRSLKKFMLDQKLIREYCVKKNRLTRVQKVYRNRNITYNLHSFQWQQMYRQQTEV